MIKYEVVGYRRATGTSKKSGKPYSGYFVHLQYADPQITGKATENTFISDEVIVGRSLALGDQLELLYNKSGYLVQVDFV